MKKTILTFLALTLALSASAAVVSLSKAESVAKAFMGASSVTLAWDGNDAVATRASAVAPAFYVYNVSGGGWVIISAEDCVTPILGYSDTGTFNSKGMPSNIRGWFGLIRNDILQARSDNLEQTEAVRKKWNNPMRVRPKTASGYKLLDTPLWNQGTPYNKLLSTYVKRNGSGVSNLYTGCVATAMAEVLYYHKWPEKGTGTLSGYTTDSYSYTVSSIDISQHTFDWANMLDSYSSGYSTAQADAVALLMLDCGVMTQMDYTTQGSGTMSEYVVPALAEHMQYSKAAQIKYRMDYTAEEWMDMIAYDIENCGPVLYGGQDTGSSGQDAGHQFVCSGYNLSDATVYINWGWSGSDNGWFTLDLAIPSSYTFDSGQSAIFGLVPDRDGSSEYPDDKESERLTLEYYSSSYTGLMLSSGTVKSGQTFSMDAGVIWNMGESDYSGTLKLVLVDGDGKLLEDNVGSTSFSIDQFYGGDATFTNCKFSTADADINVGDHLEIWFSTGSGGWSPVKYNAEDYSCTGVWQIVDASFIKVKGSYSDGDNYYFSLVPGNTPVSSISWSYDGTVTTNPFVSLTSGIHTVTAAITYTDRTSETITQELVVN